MNFYNSLHFIIKNMLYLSWFSFWNWHTLCLMYYFMKQTKILLLKSKECGSKKIEIFFYYHHESRWNSINSNILTLKSLLLPNCRWLPLPLPVWNLQNMNIWLMCTYGISFGYSTLVSIFEFSSIFEAVTI